MTTHHSVIIKDNFHAIYIVIKRVIRSLMFSPSLLHITVRYSVLLKLSLWARVVIPWHSLVHRITTTLGSQRMLLWFTTNKYYKTCSDASHGAFCLLFCTKNYQPISSIAIDYNVKKVKNWHYIPWSSWSILHIYKKYCWPLLLPHCLHCFPFWVFSYSEVHRLLTYV